MLRTFLSLAGALAALAHAPVLESAAAERIVQTDVFVGGTEGYFSFRIPSLLVTPRGTLLAICEGRKASREDHGDIDLVLRRSTDGGKTWGPIELVHDEGGNQPITIGNPCPVVDSTDGTIWLSFTRNNVDVFVTSSKDDAKTWSAPRKITADVKKPGWGWYATGPGVGIQLRNGPHKGRLMIPCDHGEGSDGQRPRYSHVFFSDDHGQTWKLGGSVAMHTNECQVVEMADGTLLINSRNHWGRDGKRPDLSGKRAVAESKDGGLTWTGLRYDADLVEPTCQASLIRHAGTGADAKGTLFFSNPASRRGRQRLTVKATDRDGKWGPSLVLQEGPAAYSCLAVLPGAMLGCLYERGEKSSYEKIVFARFPMELLTKGK